MINFASLVIFLVASWASTYALSAWLLTGNIFQNLKSLPAHHRGERDDIRMSVFSELTRMPALALILAVLGGVALYHPGDGRSNVVDEPIAPLLFLMIMPFLFTWIEVFTIKAHLAGCLVGEREWLQRYISLKWILPVLVLVPPSLLLSETINRHRYFLWSAICIYLLLVLAILARLSVFARKKSEAGPLVAPLPMKLSLGKDLIFIAAASVYVSTVAYL